MSLKRHCSIVGHYPSSKASKVRIIEKTIRYPIAAKFRFEDCNPEKIDPESIDFELKDFPDASFQISLSYAKAVVEGSKNAIFGFGVDCENNENIIQINELNLIVTIGTNVFNLKESGGNIDHKIPEFFDASQRYVVDETVNGRLEGFLMIQVKAAEEKVHFGNDFYYGERLGKKLYERDDKDFDICVSDQIIKVHKSIICSASEVFDKMIQEPYTEAKESRVAIPDFSFRVVDAAVKSCYEISVHNLTEREKLELLQFYDKYAIFDKKNLLETHLKESLATYNVCAFANASLLSNSSNLRQSCINFLSSCYDLHAVADTDKLDREIVNEFFKAAFCAKEEAED